MINKLFNSKRLRPKGFTAAEMLVASAIAGVVIGVAALVIYAVNLGTKQYSNVVSVKLPTGALNNFYPANYPSTSTTTESFLLAPNFSAAGQAENLRDRVEYDMREAVAIFPLARNMGVFNILRPTSIPAPPSTTTLDTPEAFRNYLLSVTATATGAARFTSYRNYPPLTVHCYSVFFLGYSGNTTTIPVLAVYDFDVVEARNPTTDALVGYYVTLRRYVNATTSWSGQPSAVYDVVFPLSKEGTDQWSPSIISFERQTRKVINEGSAIDMFKIAQEKPFFLMFWPDPSQDSLRLPLGRTSESTKPSLADPNPSISSSDPRKFYNHMGGRTSFMFTVPMFPST